MPLQDVPQGPILPPGWRLRRLATIYALLALYWLVLSVWVVPPVLTAAYQGRGLGPINQFFSGRRGRHSVEHYLELWRAFAGAVLLAGGLHLGVVVAAARTGLRRRRAFAVFALAFLGLTVASGPRHDYVADLEIWDRVLRGEDPWWILEDRQAPLNAYGPLFNVQAVLVPVNPLAPKLA